MMLSCIKYIVICYNFLFWLLGVAILGTSVFLFVDSQNYVDFEETSELYMTPFLLFMALGAIMTLVGFLGCCGAVRESSCILTSYFILCITMCVACGAAVWWSAENLDAVQERLQRDVVRVVREKYGRGNVGTTEKIVDAIQKDFECCGVRGPTDWAASLYNTPNLNRTVVDFGVTGTGSPGLFRVPSSCCTKNIDDQDCERLRTAVPVSRNSQSFPIGIASRGCHDKLTNYVNEQWNLLLIAAGLIIGVQSLALVLACCLCCVISRQDDK